MRTRMVALSANNVQMKRLGILMPQNWLYVWEGGMPLIFIFPRTQSVKVQETRTRLELCSLNLQPLSSHDDDVGGETWWLSFLNALPVQSQLGE